METCWDAAPPRTTCTGDVIYKYPGGAYHTPQTVFDLLEDENIDVPAENRYYPYRATHDIEVMLQPTDKQRSKKFEWTSHHVLLSVSVCSNVPRIPGMLLAWT